MPNHSHRRPKRRRSQSATPRSSRNPRLRPSNQERLSGISGNTPEEAVSFRGMSGMSSPFTTEKAAAAPETVSGGDAAVKAAYLTYLEGVEQYGADGSWETAGSNRGTMVDEIQEANNSTGQAWCGMFIGDSYAKAGIREEILTRLVFWSGYRLHLFFTQGMYIDGAFGEWCTDHRTAEIGSGTGEARKAKLDEFGPQAGDIVLFRSDYSHVGMVTSYDSETGTLEVIEGNRGNRVQATAYDTGDGQITFISRFNASDYEPGGSVDAEVQSAETPDVTHGGPGVGSTG